MPTMPRKILVLGTNGCWGKGDDLKTALRNAHRPKHYNAYEVHQDATVSDYGSILYPGDAVDDAPHLIIQK